MKTLELTVENTIAEIIFNRPEHSNSVTLDTFDDLLEVAGVINADSDIRVVVMTGEGKHFCAGLDMSLFPREEGPVDWFERSAFKPLDDKGANLFQRCAIVWRELRVPVIAAVNGVAFGGGCQLALGADIRIADDTTRMSLLETHWGLIPDMGLSATLPSLMAQDVAAELILSAKILNGQEAKEAGLVTSVADDCYQSAKALAENIAGKSPTAIQAAKRLYRYAWGGPVKGALPYEAQLQKELIGSAEQLAVVKANFKKR